MELASVRPDDIVRVHKKGRVVEALVLCKRKGGLEIEPLQRGIDAIGRIAAVALAAPERGDRREAARIVGAAPPLQRDPGPLAAERGRDTEAVTRPAEEPWPSPRTSCIAAACWLPGRWRREGARPGRPAVPGSGD